MSDSNDRGTRPYGFEFGAENDAEALQFEAVLARLGAASASHDVPAGLKSDILSRLDSLPQLPAEIAPVARPGLTAVPAARDNDQWMPTTAAPTSAERRATARWFSRPVLALSAAAAAVVLFGGGALVGGVVGSSPSTPQASALVSVAAASDAHRAFAEVSGGGTATVMSSDSLGKSVILLHGVSKAPSDKTYQLWYIKGSKIDSAGTFTVSSPTATTAVALSGTLTKGAVVGMTVEPAGGSKQPTSKPVVALNT